MNAILKKLTDGASDASSLALSIADSGLRSVSEIFRNTKIFGAISASTVEHLEYDETHYVLVPLLGPQRDYAIYTKRILPPDIGATNSLPKLRIFHVPDVSGKELLDQKLIANIVSSKMDHHAGTSDLADTLENLANQIDAETNRISGGLILIGGAVAFVNPLLGVGIAAKGLLPSIGSKVSKAGAEYVGNMLRDWNKSSATSKLQKDASSEVLGLKPRIYSNPVIRSLEAIATNPETEFDPFFDRRNWADQFESLHHYKVTAEAIREVYEEHLPSVDLAAYQEPHIQWIRSFLEDNRIL